MDDTSGYASLAAHLNSKKAGPLVCPICKVTESFEAKGTLGGPHSDPLPSTDLPASAEPGFGYAACTNCGYSIFFDAGALPPPE
jgi:predicted nucleic-acid-binding Zn-ribbon protein